MERRNAADFETRLIPDALNKRDGVGGYVEALPKYLPHFLHPLLNLKPFPTRFCGILEDAADSAFRSCDLRIQTPRSCELLNSA
jgi:hypothetical protein